MSDIMTFHAVHSGNGALKPEDIALVALEDEDSFLAEAGFDAESLEGITQYLTSLGLTNLRGKPRPSGRGGIAHTAKR